MIELENAWKPTDRDREENGRAAALRIKKSNSHFNYATLVVALQGNNARHCVHCSLFTVGGNTLNSFSSNLTSFRSRFFLRTSSSSFEDARFSFSSLVLFGLVWLLPAFERWECAFLPRNTHISSVNKFSNKSQTTFSSRKLTFILKQLCSSTSCCHFSFV